MHGRSSLAVAVVVGGLAGLPVLSTGCKTETDNNVPCTLVKSGPDGGSVPVTEKEVRAAAGFSKDFLTFPAVECRDLICIRDGEYVSTAGDDQPATGYCTNDCVPGDLCASNDEALDKQPSTKLTCRALLLDEATLAALCKNTATCDQVGGFTSPYFCARGGGSADAGN